MIAGKLLVGLSVLSAAAVAHPGYSSLSEAIMSSMTDLWNEKQASQSSTSDESQSDWLDIFSDSDSESISTDDSKMPIHSQNPTQLTNSPYSPPTIVKNTDQQKSDYVQYPGRRNPFFGRRGVRPSPHPNTTNRNLVKSAKKDPGPLYRALYNSHPLSFEHLLHYYDYLDDYSSDESCNKETSSTSQNKSNFGEAIESLLSKFISKLTGFIDRPVVVQANVCCSSPAPDLMATHNTSEPSLQTPHYITKIPSSDRYAADQVDIVKQMKEQYDKVIRLMNMVSQANENSNHKAQGPTQASAIPATAPEETYFASSSTSPPLIVVETSSPAITDATPSTLIIVDTSSPSSNGVELTKTATSTLLPPVVLEADIETNPKDAVENITIEVLKELTTEFPDALTTDTTDHTSAENTMTEINPPAEENSVIPSTELAANSPPLKRKRRDTRTKKQRKTTTEKPAGLKDDTSTTEPSNLEDINYDEFLKNVLENKTSVLETLILNRDPIVEHIHAHLLDHERKLGIEWQPPNKKDCENSTSTSVTDSSIDSEEIISDPPDFIESIEVKTKTKLGKSA